jgi:DNA-binding IclR family transcriptional regulator
VAAPVRDRTGRTVASLGVTGPLTRMSPTRLTELVSVVVEAAEEVSRQLGHAPALAAAPSA